MVDFPWEIIKAETLRSVARDLGVPGSLKRDEIIVFLRAVQKRGLGPALSEEITKSLVSSSSAVISSNKNGETTSISAVSKSTRKRAASVEEDAEGGVDNEVANATTGEEGDATDVNEGREQQHNTRFRGSKRVKVSETKPEPPRRSGRSRKSDVTENVSASTRSRSKSNVAEPRKLSYRMSVGGRPRKSVTIADPPADNEEYEEADAEGETDVESDNETENNQSEEQTEDDTGAAGLVTAFSKAGENNAPTRGRRGSLSNITRKETRSTSRPRRPTTRRSLSAGANISGETRTRSTRQAKVESNPGPKRISTRIHKPSVKSLLMADITSPSRASRSNVRELTKASITPPTSHQQMLLSKHPKKRGRPRKSSISAGGLSVGGEVMDGVIINFDSISTNTRKDVQKEVFDGVVLKKRRLENGHEENRGMMQLDEFVSNGVYRGDVGDTMMDANGEPDGEGEETSSLGGSNKENDFSFRDVSMSEGPDERLIVNPPEVGGEDEQQNGNINTAASANETTVAVAPEVNATPQVNVQNSSQQGETGQQEIRTQPNDIIQTSTSTDITMSLTTTTTSTDIGGLPPPMPPPLFVIQHEIPTNRATLSSILAPLVPSPHPHQPSTSSSSLAFALGSHTTNTNTTATTGANAITPPALNLASMLEEERPYRPPPDAIQPNPTVNAVIYPTPKWQAYPTIQPLVPSPSRLTTYQSPLHPIPQLAESSTSVQSGSGNDVNVGVGLNQNQNQDQDQQQQQQQQEGQGGERQVDGSGSSQQEN